MAESLQRTDAARYKIEELLDLVTSGRLRVPRFQRGLRWTALDVERLFDSIYNGYPIGTLLLWEKPAEAQTVELGPVRIEAPERPDALWVVDGQQRITSLAASLLPADIVGSASYDLSFDLANERFVRGTPRDRSQSRIPVRGAYDLQRVLGWLRERELGAEMEERAFRLANQLRNFEVPAYIVATEDEAALRQIFDRTNTFGKQMTRAEVFHALNTATSAGSPDLRTLGEEVSGLGFGEIRDNALLFCVLAVRGPDVFREFRSEFKTDSDLTEALEAARVAIGRSVDFLRSEAGVPHLDLVPYQHLLVGLVRFFALYETPSEWDLLLLRRWFWRAAVHGPLAKQGSTGTLRATLNAIAPGSANTAVTELLDVVPSERATARVGQFRWNIADARVAMCVLAAQSPIDLVSGEVIDVTESIDRLGKESLVALFPNGLDDLVRTPANRVFASSADEGGSVIAQDELVSALAASDDLVRRSHAVSDEAAAALAVGDAGRFLHARAEVLQTLMENFVDSRAEWERSARPPIASLPFADSK